MAEHQHGQHQHGHQHHHPSRRRALHKDWRAWLVIGLMLAAMAMYVMTNNEGDQPGAPPGQGMPVDGAPADAAP